MRRTQNESEEKRPLESTESDEIDLLPAEGKTIEAFVPKGWKLMDSINVDFNNDGFMDVIGVLEVDGSDMTPDDIYDSPRLLFAIENSGDTSFKLSFQDENLIRTQFEGGVFGDPYLPLSVENGNFSTHAYGGSSWKWSEDRTYSYRNGDWYLIASEETYGQGPYITQYRQNNYDTRVGKRSYNSENDEIMMQRGESWTAFDLEFEIEIEAPLKLKTFSIRNAFDREQIEDKRADKVIVSEALKLDEDQVTALKQKAIAIEQVCFKDLEFIAYTFKSDDGKFEYLAVYNRSSGISTIVDQCERLEEDWLSSFEYVVIDQGYIYYNGYASETIHYTDDQGESSRSDELVSSYLCSVSIDGTDKKIRFTYDNQVDAEGRYPYISITFEIHAGKIILSTYSEHEISYTRMNLESSEMEFLGNIKN
ncbi:hypothetical protein [Fusibacter sp. 3D3]|uniref:hypothetical protein n=1 Tax=Fusibacter sp. 3D3 TaxID=1048380 RepID=UPI000853A3AB|nr:hypothetical protein [Fusibacter sp. 3D3]GAU76431.1 hypothetical protein F3D3_1028 [Fusibacter sp. 3D3]